VPGHRLCIVMVCQDMSEAVQAGRQLSQVNNGSLITYRRAEDVLMNCPTGNVALIVLASSDDPAVTSAVLGWMRHRWPRCPLVVIGDGGGGELEMTARKGGASYLARPVSAEQWAAMVGHAFSPRGQEAAAKEERLG
jgi:FixJ family two-component response regulator